MSGELILIVEDDVVNAKLLRDVLRAHAYATHEVSTGEEALSVATEHQPALILMDVQLPGMTGIETLARLRAQAATAAIPTIAVTASVMQQNRADIDAAGFDGYHGKPIDIKEMLAQVRRIMDERLVG